MKKRWLDMWEALAPDDGGEGGGAEGEGGGDDDADSDDKGLLGGGAGEKGGDEGDGGQPKGEKPVVPESYEFEVPEGRSIDPSAIETYTPILKELGLTQEQANKLFNAQMELADKQIERVESQSKEWLNEVRNDPDLGGENFKATARGLDAVMSKYGDAELTEFLDLAGLTNHPPLVRFVAKIAKALGEDSVSGAGGRTGGKPVDEDERNRRDYPSMFEEGKAS